MATINKQGTGGGQNVAGVMTLAEQAQAIPWYSEFRFRTEDVTAVSAGDKFVLDLGAIPARHAVVSLRAESDLVTNLLAGYDFELGIAEDGVEYIPTTAVGANARLGPVFATTTPRTDFENPTPVVATMSFGATAVLNIAAMPRIRVYAMLVNVTQT